MVIKMTSMITSRAAMISLLFFLFDFTLYAICDRWVISSLVAYFVYAGVKDNVRILPFFLLLLQDFFLYGRFGWGLVYLIPLVAGIMLMKKICHRYWWTLGGYVLLLPLGSTLGHIFGIIIVMTFLIVFGTRGNRFLSVFRVRRGKSGLQTGWMPYKKGLFERCFK